MYRTTVAWLSSLAKHGEVVGQSIGLLLYKLSSMCVKNGQMLVFLSSPRPPSKILSIEYVTAWGYQQITSSMASTIKCYTKGLGNQATAPKWFRRIQAGTSIPVATAHWDAVRPRNKVLLSLSFLMLQEPVRSSSKVSKQRKLFLRIIKVREPQ